MQSADFKGKSLEVAVHAIESAILATDPRLSESAFTIESRKRIVRHGVTHEIDVWVEVAFGKGMNVAFIFECRNRKTSADKNDIVVFSEKIKAAPAQTGYFIAKSFSKDARAQALQDPRIQLLLAESHAELDIPIPLGFHGREVTRNKITLSAFKPGATETKPGIKIDPESSVFIIDGQPQPAMKLATQLAEQIIHHRIDSMPELGSTPGTHELDQLNRVIHFQPGQCMLDGSEIDRFSCNVSATVKITVPKVISIWNVESRGRIHTLDLAIANSVVGTHFIEL